MRKYMKSGMLDIIFAVFIIVAVGIPSIIINSNDPYEQTPKNF